ncbi:sulfurtransferase [Sulfuriferula sp. AH1]|uniref:sulfurtransferase n=1 Tax=Sulfuriferula sp. AH1 TaxID=1985873 RepID=UPI000B3B5D99|nr:sulfurtransferase [Sulfuriferula sp. AH1]ARU30696.1 sulfurtransferase [Sulfuriferula sp. AH1]
MSSILNIAAYRFVELDQLPELREQFRQRSAAHKLKGTILLTPEGINMFLAGEETELEAFIGWLTGDARFADIEIKRSWSDEVPFNRMLVKLKKEIITFHQPDFDRTAHPASQLPAAELKKWYDEGREFIIVDTRNDFEYQVGTFKNAVNLQLNTFGDFAAATEQLKDYRNIPIVTFCTGGVRCEKAAPFMAGEGFNQVYQLQGGILKYFEECGASHYDGECFVFDKRVALDGNLKPTDTCICFACRTVLTPDEQASPDYVVGVSCPHCASKPVAA